MRRIIIVAACIILLTVFVLYFVHIIPETIQSRVPGEQYIVSLGDSVAAGAGLDTNSRHDNNDCDLSESAFPYLLGEQLHKPVAQFACSGATVAQSDNTLLTQYKMAEPYLRGSDVVVYAGANDVGWLQTLINCMQTNCVNDQNRSALASKLQILKKNLSSLLGQIQQAKPNKLIVNTYYQLVPSDSRCFSRFGITPQDSTFINNEEALLNSIITSAANESNASPVNINFSGHLLCDPQPWIQNITANAPMHPTAAGQIQIANEDAKAISVANGN